MITELNNSKDAIRGRMLKHALNYWDIKNADDLDPVVKMLLEALAIELYHVSNDVKNTQVRMLEKIANLLTPEFLTSASPAHGILKVLPAEPVEILSDATSFVAQKKVASKPNEPPDTNLDIYFTPVDAIRIFDAQVFYSKTGSNLYEHDLLQNKNLKARAEAETAREASTLWLGLKVNPKIDSIDNFYFYFDCKNLEPGATERIYELLPLSKWYAAGEEIKVLTGLPYTMEQAGSDLHDYPGIDYNLASAIQKDVKHYYEPKYLCINDTRKGGIENLKMCYPVQFKSLFANADLDQLKEKLLWIKIVFPAAVKQEYLEDLNIFLNAFPIINRQLIELNFRLKGGSNIIPLKTSPPDQFLYVKSISDGNHHYKALPFKKMEDEAIGTYTLRNGGVERFDTRDARDLINYLLELVRSESAAFSAYGYDFIATILKEMNQRMALIEQKTSGSVNRVAEIPNYVIVRPFEGQDMMSVEYWSTLADAANTLRSGTRLQQVKGSSVKPDSVILLTTTIGGKKRLKPEERLPAFRYSIMTRNRIVTKEDIRHFCFFELGSRISRVSVEAGYEMSAQPNEGFTRTINVILSPSDKEMLSNAEWQVLCDQVKSKLTMRSGMSNHYRVFTAAFKK